MILSETVEVQVMGTAIKHWRSLGYEFPNPNVRKGFIPKITVKVSELKSKGVIVNCMCNTCGSKFKRQIRNNTDRCDECWRIEFGKSRIGTSYGKAHKGKPNLKVRGEKHGKFNPNRSELKLYSCKVRAITRLQNTDSLPNSDKPRGRNGVEGAYQLDHITSIKRGFLEDISPEIIGDISNLQFIPWKENRSKAAR